MHTHFFVENTASEIKYFSSVFKKKYATGTHQKFLSETLLMSTTIYDFVEK